VLGARVFKWTDEDRAVLYKACCERSDDEWDSILSCFPARTPAAVKCQCKSQVFKQWCADSSLTLPKWIQPNESKPKPVARGEWAEEGLTIEDAAREAQVGAWSDNEQFELRKAAMELGWNYEALAEGFKGRTATAIRAKLNSSSFKKFCSKHKLTLCRFTYERSGEEESTAREPRDKASVTADATATVHGSVNGNGDAESSLGRRPVKQRERKCQHLILPNYVD
jgi:hypothetical protein